jgi:putative ABC transport system permease protein
MFRAVLTNALADLRHRWLQTVLVFFVIAAAATTLMLALTVRSGASQPYERALEAAHGPHAWFFWGRAEVQEIAQRDGVEGTVGPFATSYNYTATVGGERHDVRFWAAGAELPNVAPALLSKGRWLSTDGQDEVVIDAGFAHETGVEVGDRITIAAEKGWVTLDVVGIAANFARAPYPIWSPAGFYVTSATFDRLTGGRVNAWTLGVRLEDAATSERFVDQVRDDLPSIYAWTWQEIASDVEDVNAPNAIFLAVFSAFALLAVGFIIANTISGQVLAQFREIGLLKAVGCTPGQVTGLLLLENMLIAVPAALAGVVLGWVLSPLFLRSVANLFGMSALPPFDFVLASVVVAGVAVIVLVFTAVPAWRAGRLSTLRALTTGVAAEASRPSLPAKFAGWLRLPPLLVIAVKDAFSRPVRAALTIGALTLAVVTVTFMLGLDATLTGARDNPTRFGGEPFELTVIPRDLPRDDVEALIEAQPGVARYVTRTWFEPRIPGRDHALGMWALAGDYEDMGFPIVDGRMFSGPGEAVLGLGLARELNLGVGDRITVLINGRELSLPVVGTYVEDNNRGRMMMFDSATTADIVPDPQFVTYGVQLARGVDPEEVKASLLRDAGNGIDVDNLAQGWVDSVEQSRGEVRTVLLALNGVLLMIAAVNLLTTLLFTVRERRRDVGVLKSIGLTPVQVTSAFVTGSAVLAVIAVAVGIPAGMFVVDFLIDFAGHEEGWPKGLAQAPGIGLLLLVVPLTIAVAAIGSALPALQAGRSRITDALRYE